LVLDSAPTIKIIPSVIRPLVTSLFEDQLYAINKEPANIIRWIELFLIRRAILRCWFAGDTRYHLHCRKRNSALIKSITERVKNWKMGGNQRDHLFKKLFLNRVELPTPENSEATKVRRCIKLIREVDQYRKAVQALTPNGTAVQSKKKLLTPLEANTLMALNWKYSITQVVTLFNSINLTY
jgi:hypothetical protein